MIYALHLKCYQTLPTFKPLTIKLYERLIETIHHGTWFVFSCTPLKKKFGQYRVSRHLSSNRFLSGCKDTFL